MDEFVKLNLFFAEPDSQDTEQPYGQTFSGFNEPWEAQQPSLDNQAPHQPTHRLSSVAPPSNPSGTASTPLAEQSLRPNQQGRFASTREQNDYTLSTASRNAVQSSAPSVGLVPQDTQLHDQGNPLNDFTSSESFGLNPGLGTGTLSTRFDENADHEAPRSSRHPQWAPQAGPRNQFDTSAGPSASNEYVSISGYPPTSNEQALIPGVSGVISPFDPSRMSLVEDNVQRSVIPDHIQNLTLPSRIASSSDNTNRGTSAPMTYELLDYPHNTSVLGPWSYDANYTDDFFLPHASSMEDQTLPQPARSSSSMYGQAEKIPFLSQPGNTPGLNFSPHPLLMSNLAMLQNQAPYAHVSNLHQLSQTGPLTHEPGAAASLDNADNLWSLNPTNAQPHIPFLWPGQSSYPGPDRLAPSNLPGFTAELPQQTLPHKNLLPSSSEPLTQDRLNLGNSEGSSNGGLPFVRESRESSWVLTDPSSGSGGYVVTPGSHETVWVGSVSDRPGSEAVSIDQQLRHGPLTATSPSNDGSGVGKKELDKGKGRMQELQIVMYGEEEPSRKRKATGVAISDTKPILEVVRYNDKGQVQAVEQTLGNPSRKVKGPYDAERRKATACCRETGACDTCARGHKRCDLHEKSPYEPCTPCATRTKTYKGMCRLPCFLSQMVDAVFFRKGPSIASPQYFGRHTVYVVDSSSHAHQLLSPEIEIRTLQLTQIYGAQLEVYVARFTEHPGDKVNISELNEDGVEYFKKMPPYCLADIQRNKSNMEAYIQRERGRYLRLLQMKDDPNSITKLTVEAAIAYASKYPKSTTSMALDMWAYCRVIELEWKMSGEDTLGLCKDEDPKSPWHDFIPITPMMDVQLDQIVIRVILNPLRQRLMLKLEEMIKQHIPSDWFDCYLTMYLLLNHIEWACAHGNSFSKRYGLGRRYSDMKLAEGWFHTSKILLSRFHFWSNGADPFQIDWTKPKNVKYAKLDKEQVSFMQRLQHLVKQKEPHFKELKGMYRYEQDLYWTHQLFSSKWDSGLAHIVEELPTEGGFDEGMHVVRLM